MQWGYYGGRAGGLGGLLWLLLFGVAVVALIWLLVVLIRRSQNGPGTWQPPAPPVAPPVAPPRPEPLDILRERFARGEITQEEFETAKRVLGYGP